MKALVTGAAGSSDRLSPSAARRRRRRRRASTASPTTIRAPIKEAEPRRDSRARRVSGFVEVAIQDADLPALLDGVTHVFHLAAQAGVRKSWGRDFDVYTVNNIEATQVLLEACVGRPLERFVYASSSSVYGDNVAMPMREDALPQPVSPYGVTKLAAEQLCYLYHVELRRADRVAAVLHRLRAAAAARHGVPPVPPRRARSASRSRSTATASRRATSRSCPTRSRRQSRPATAACPGASTISAAARASRQRGARHDRPRRPAGPLKVRREAAQKGDMRHTYADTGARADRSGFAPSVSLEEGLEAEYRWLSTISAVA